MVLEGFVSGVQQLLVYILVFALALVGLRLFQHTKSCGLDNHSSDDSQSTNRAAVGSAGRSKASKKKGKKKKHRPPSHSDAPAEHRAEPTSGAANPSPSQPPSIAAATATSTSRATKPTTATGPARPTFVARFAEGERVEAQVGSRQEPGTVTRVHSDGRIDIEFDSGVRQEKVAGNLVASQKELDAFAGSLQKSEMKGGGSLREAALDRASAHGVKEGDPVEARWENGPDFFPGVVVKVHRDGLYNIQYDDGEVETKVTPQSIRRPGEFNTLAVARKDLESEEEEEDDGWQLISANKVSKAERAARQEAEANNIRNRKKKEKRRERERERIEFFRKNL